MKLRVILSALVALVAVLIFAAGSTNVVRAEEHTVLAGHDLFETDPSETFQKICSEYGRDCGLRHCSRAARRCYFPCRTPDDRYRNRRAEPCERGAHYGYRLPRRRPELGGNG